MITISFGPGNSMPIDASRITGPNDLISPTIRNFLGAPDNVEPRLGGSLVTGSVPDGSHVELVTRANTKGY